MKIQNSIEFGKQCKKRRKELGHTQAYISEVSGLSASFISDVENGKTTVELGKVIRLANLLAMDLHLEERK